MFKNYKNHIFSYVLAVVVSLSTIIPNGIVFAAENTGGLSFNYGEALQKAIMFYEFQRSGVLPKDKRDNWRGDSGLNDGSDVGVDLTGGWYDAGDHVKFNLPMSYTVTMLAWSLNEDQDTYIKSGQYDYMVDTIKWGADYLMKCHTKENEYYYQVGDGGADHAWWGPAEVMQMEMKRPSYKLDLDNPGSAVVGESAAALAATAAALKDSDPEYANKCLKHAKELFNFADITKSDKGYTAANSYYSSWSGFYDELSWAAVWIYIASGDQTYLDKAESYVPNWGKENQTTTIAYRWVHCWDDVHYGAQILLAKVTGKDIYKESVERNLDFWTTGYNGQRVNYSKDGLACIDTWGSLRYATTMAFLADVYADSSICTATKVDTYKEFAKSQVDYALGSTGRSYVVGFGVNPPEHPHHRTAHSSWSDQLENPDYHRHVLYGALVGGPDQTGSYTDDIKDFRSNEVACDYNAGFVGILARMYDDFGGNPIPNFNAVEVPTNDEFFVEAGVNASGENFVEIKGIINNKTGWPARVADKLSFKYFLDISEFVEMGYSEKDIKVSLNYNQGGTVSELMPWDESNNIYYVNVDFTGTPIYPGGQSEYKKEIQFRISGPQNIRIWDNSNDFSYEGIVTTPGATPVLAKNIPVYDDGVKVYGNEPDSGGSSTIVGDINGDGGIDSFDSLILKQYFLEVVDTINMKAADTNEDNEINSTDYALLKMYLLELVSDLPK